MGDKYHRYEKISESSMEWDMKKNRSEFKKKVEWVVTEKVHGANFVMMVKPSESGELVVSCGKRTGILEEHDEFFNGYKNVFNKYKEPSLAAFNWIKRNMKIDFSSVYIYGELFGGGYPHNDVMPDENVTLVQSGIYYTPTLEFYAFDIMVEPNDGTSMYLDFIDSLKVFKECNFFYAEPLFSGTFEDVSNFKVGFESTIPSKLGLPKLSQPNVAEGVVIRRLTDLWVESNGLKKEKLRALMKIKVEGFKEEQPLPASLQGKSYKGKEKQVESKKLKPFEVASLLSESMVTENRLQNVISKVGQVRKKDKAQEGVILNLFVQDVMDQFELEKHKENWEKLSKKEKTDIQQRVTELCRGLVKIKFS
eukprot:TRINITY_DN5665_c0_g2_i1.p1 TRINITY_DN5665_c0_g2~~TRINITY_DN5665_c0_g2_i1.p1  ORF type:complete len:365 (-),score=73.64 TRINITY_DN5665_c0_g2_i1:267-1361(-)